jgi:predicted permease
LSLGIGATTAIFSILNAAMLRSLPVQDPHRLVKFVNDESVSFTNPLWEQIRETQNVCSGTLAYCSTQFDLAPEGEKCLVHGMWVSGDFFKVLGVVPSLGRVFTPDDDLHGVGEAGPVAVISHRFWQGHFGGHPNVLGKRLRLDGHQFEIVGVTPPQFKGLEPDYAYDVAIPIGCEPILHPDGSALSHRSWWWLSIVGRLRPGLTPEQASAGLKIVTPAIMAATLPADYDAIGQKQYLRRVLQVRPGASGFLGIGSEYRTALLTVMAVVGLVLLIACGNIANLLLARAAARQHEFSIRVAIGAGRLRLLRQLLTESLLLGTLGIPGGLLLAKWGSRLLVRLFSTTSDPLQIDVSLDATVLLFTVAVTFVTGLLFGLAPALGATRVSAGEVLKKNTGGSVRGASRLNFGRALVAGQMALSLVLMVAAGLFVGTLRNLLKEPLGFDGHNVLAIHVDTQQKVPKEQRVPLFNAILERVRRVPGVRSAAFATSSPISNQGWNDNLFTDGAEEKDSPDQVAWLNRVSPGYFATMRTAILAGRDFEAQDNLSSPKVMIIGEKTARDFFGSRNPIGQYLKIGYGPGSRGRFEIIGVVNDSKYNQVKEPTRRTVFLPLGQDRDPWPGATILARVDGRAENVIPAIRAAVAEARPGLSLVSKRFDAWIIDSLRQERTVAWLSSFFGGLALFLAVIGLYGVTSYGVAQRRSEFGVRMALGAQPMSLVWLVLRDVAIILALGLVLGLALSTGAGRFVASLVYGVSPNDGMTFLSAALALSAAGTIAGLLPAWRASRLDPSKLLRFE